MLAENMQIMEFKAKCKVCRTASDLCCERCYDTYCSDLCQKRDWKQHRYICFPMPTLVTNQVEEENEDPLVTKQMTKKPESDTESKLMSDDIEYSKPKKNKKAQKSGKNESDCEIVILTEPSEASISIKTKSSKAKDNTAKDEIKFKQEMAYVSAYTSEEETFSEVNSDGTLSEVPYKVETKSRKSKNNVTKQVQGKPPKNVHDKENQIEPPKVKKNTPKIEKSSKFPKVESNITDSMLRRLRAYKAKPEEPTKTTKICFKDLYPVPLAIGMEGKFVVTHINPEGVIGICEYSKSNLKFLNSVYELLTDYMETVNINAVAGYHPEIDEACLALYDGLWYRGACLQNYGSKSKLLLFDFGIICKVDHLKIIPFPKELKNPKPRTYLAIVEDCEEKQVSDLEVFSKHKFRVDELDEELYTISFI